LLLHHFDFYRLQEGGIVAHELSEVLNDQKAVVVVEWGDVVSNVLPNEHIELQLERQVQAMDARLLSAVYPDKFNYIFKDQE